jgi:uncharacterized protein YlxP (DUF503 family)
MFVAVARLTLSIPEANSLKAKRHVLHKVVDKVRARFNVAIAEVADNDLWQRATLGVAAVANEHAFAQESVSKVIKFIEDLYVAPLVSCSTEVVPLGGDLFGGGKDSTWGAEAQGTERTLAEAEAEERGERADRQAGPEVPPRRAELPSFAAAYAASREQRAAKAANRSRRTMSASERARAIEDLRRRLRESRRRPEDDAEDE